ncbi:AraC-like ligand-binding domain-containing protein [Nocardia sp. R6R-6]|uniref:AraC-like ligand-binding domain-containing protein n=1 Tax=Nocardia sp. R6R-6 TaxID=3459303 RepID=UPI00403E210E
MTVITNTARMGARPEELLLIDKRPLAAHRLVESTDPDVVRAAVRSEFSDHRLSPLTRGRALDTHFHGLRWGGAGVYYLEYGTDVRVDPRDLDGFYLVQVPLAGRVSMSVGSEKFVSTPDRAAVLGPGARVSMSVERPNRELLLLLDQSSVDEALRKELDRDPRAPVVFEPQMDLTTPANRTFRGLLTLLVDAVDTETTRSVAVQEFGRLLAGQLLLGQPNNYRDEIDEQPRPTVARPIARALDLIEAHAHEPLTVADVAEAVGIGTRALQDGFRRYYDTTPMTFLRDVRLRRVRTDLMEADPARTTVADVAARWGFLHPGRFSALYRARFGEMPSQTLRLGHYAATSEARL